MSADNNQYNVVRLHLGAAVINLVSTYVEVKLTYIR